MSKRYLGVDITANSVRIVGIKGGRKPVFLGCKELILEKQEVTKEDLFDTIQLGQLLQRAPKEAAPKPLGHFPAITSVPESEVFRKIIELPLISDPDELAAVIRLQTAEFLPQSTEESETDFQYLSTLPDGKTQQIMVVSTPSSVSDQYVDIFKQAKLPLKAIDVRSAALGRSIISDSEKKAIIVVNTEGKTTAVSLHQGGLVRATSSISTRTGEDEEDDEVRIKELTTALVDEIDHVIKFYTNRTADHVAVKEIHLAAFGSWLTGLQKTLSKEVDLPVSIAKPIIQVPAFCDARFLVALGCALYPFESKV